MRNDDLLTGLGLALKLQRVRLGLSQEDAAHRAGVARSFYSTIERGERNITLSTAARMAEGLGVPLWRLVRDAEEPPEA